MASRTRCCRGLLITPSASAANFSSTSDVAERIPRIAFGVIELFAEFFPIGRGDRDRDALQCRKDLLNLGVGNHFNLAQLGADLGDR